MVSYYTPSCTLLGRKKYRVLVTSCSALSLLHYRVAAAVNESCRVRVDCPPTNHLAVRSKITLLTTYPKARSSWHMHGSSSLALQDKTEERACFPSCYLLVFMHQSWAVSQWPAVSLNGFCVCVNFAPAGQLLRASSYNPDRTNPIRNGLALVLILSGLPSERPNKASLQEKVKRTNHLWFGKKMTVCVAWYDSHR